MDSLKKNARIAGIFYLLLAITGFYGLMYVSSQITVRGDAVATANNIFSNEFLFRTGIASSILAVVIFVYLVLFLYKLLKEVNGHQARLMVGLVFVAIPIAFLASVFKITALMILKGSILQSFEPEQINDLATLFLKIASYDAQMVQLFWGLWLLPFGQLVYKSGFIPRIFGALIILNGIAYIILCLTFLLFPQHRTIVSQLAIPFLFLGEFPIIFWLLIKGVKVKHVSNN